MDNWHNNWGAHMRGIIWYKKDLRLADHPALYAACKQCTDGIIAIYILDVEMWEQHRIAHCHILFILQTLKILHADLEKMGIPLFIEYAEKTSHIPEILFKTIKKFKINKLFFNRELEINESRREQAAVNFLTKNNIDCAAFDEQLILPAEKIQTNQGRHFKIFTAFKNRWLQAFKESSVKLLPIPKTLFDVHHNLPFTLPKEFIPHSSTIDFSHWPAGEKSALKILNTFLKTKLFHYDKKRDFPALDATSHLSPYLAIGAISARTCFLSALTANAYELDSGNKGALTWMSELIWRDFYRYILIHVPRICMNRAYRPETENIPWSYDSHLLRAWQQGKTGFPLVDAAMRQLNTTGWMHNRLRMVTAMFLSKNLLLDWRLGERYFTENLIDVDFASNNGGWQWSASTGVDAVPYFRIFNPTTQSERFDSEGNFIRQYCPELAKLNNKAIHDPYNRQPLIAQTTGYPKPIINYSESRQRAIAIFKAI